MVRCVRRRASPWRSSEHASRSPTAASAPVSVVLRLGLLIGAEEEKMARWRDENGAAGRSMNISVLLVLHRLTTFLSRMQR